MRALIFVNGELADPAAFNALLRADDLLIAADGGARHLEAMGRRPQVLVGDLDSIDPALVADYERHGVRIERHPVAKDQTDLELAIEHALKAKPDAIWLVGAMGGRMDHSLANLLILAQRRWSPPLQVVDGAQVLTLLRGPGTAALAGAVGQTVSVIPLSAKATGVTYAGLEYPLTNATLPLGSTRGVSNRLASELASVSVKRGLLLLAMAMPGPAEPAA